MSYIIHPNKDLTKPIKQLKKKPSPIKKKGKEANRWNRVKRSWFKYYNLQFYTCYICGKVMPPNETTLDHIIPRSNAKNYDKRHDFDNLAPCCWKCNGEKGSKVMLDNHA